MPSPELAFSSTSGPQRRLGPAFVLVLLSPIIAYGATRLSVIFVLLPEIMTWGCAALLIREVAWRWRKGWPSLLSLGLALAVAEEFIIQQTSIAPLVGLARHSYGRVWGVNWVYFLWALGYESVWVVLVPVSLTELLYPERRYQCWLRTRGLVIAGVVFAVGAFMAWYGWTQRARVKVFHMPPYTPSPILLLAGAVLILFLILAAYLLPPSRPETDREPAPSPLTAGLIICALGIPWTAFVLLGFGTLPTIPFLPVLAAGIAWAAITLFLVRRWTSSPHWSDAHRFALTFGGVLACMLGGFVVFKVGGALRIDWIGKAVMNFAALAWLLSVGARVKLQKK